MEHKVHIIDDDEDIRIALSGLMRTEGLGNKSYSCAEEFLDSAAVNDKGCVLADMRMPGMSGLELHDEMERRSLFLPVVIMTGHADVDVAVKAMKEGVLDFISKPFDSSVLLSAVRNCLDGCNDYHEKRLYQDRVTGLVSRLTKRERQVMDLLVSGFQNKEIARKLDISPRTVELHRAKVMEKLKAHTVSDVVRAGIAYSDAALHH